METNVALVLVLLSEDEQCEMVTRRMAELEAAKQAALTAEDYEACAPLRDQQRLLASTGESVVGRVVVSAVAGPGHGASNGNIDGLGRHCWGVVNKYFTADVNILTVPAVGWEGAALAALASVGCQALLVLLGPAMAVPVALAALERLAETYEDSLALSMLCTTSVEAAWTGSMDEDELFNWCIDHQFEHVPLGTDFLASWGAVTPVAAADSADSDGSAGDGSAVDSDTG
jgi:hypothetical protein